MHRKRLKNIANTLCQMFCGWRLNGSKRMLVELGSGSLEINALTGQCNFQDRPISQVPIAVELTAWMRQDLEIHRIPAALLTRARLSAKLSFSRIPWNTRTKEIFYVGGSAVRTESMHECIFECDSEVATIAAVYRAKQREIQCWPVGWPAA
jgi:hypothetical protein